MVYTPVASEVVRSLVYTNISWENLSSARTWPLTNSEYFYDRAITTKFQLSYRDIMGGGEYVDIGAEEDITGVEIRLTVQPTSRKPVTVNSYLKDASHVIEEIKRVVRQNRTNASGYEFIYIPKNGVHNLDVLNDPDVDPPFIERVINIRLRKYRGELT